MTRMIMIELRVADGSGLKAGIALFGIHSHQRKLMLGFAGVGWNFNGV